jgi:hypothetical protein
VNEAIVLIKYDLGTPWIRLALSQWSTVFLAPMVFTPVIKKRKGSIRKKRTHTVMSGVGGEGQYCLMYRGVRMREFYGAFRGFGLVPGLNCPSYRAE